MPRPGTYFATDADGSWKVKRLSTQVAESSLVIDSARGNVYVVFPDRGSLRQFTRAADGSWTNERLAGTARIHDVVVRADPASGALLLIGSYWQDGKDGIDIVALTAS
jgi:hypothetical protein